MIAVNLSHDIILDEEAFSSAANDFADLGKRLDRLRQDVTDMVNTLKTGFNTPAGEIFIKSCETNLFKPLDDQKLVLDHISETLGDARQAYESVFREYEALQTEINQKGNN